MLCEEGHSSICARQQCSTRAGQLNNRVQRLAPPQLKAQPRCCQRKACIAKADSRPNTMIGAVAMNRPELALERTADSALPCPRQGIKNDATELVGYTPMVRKLLAVTLIAK